MPLHFLLTPFFINEHCLKADHTAKCDLLFVILPDHMSIFSVFVQILQLNAEIYLHFGLTVL